MLKETKTSLRTWFAVVTVLFLLMGAGRVAQVILLLRGRPEARLSPLFLIQTVFILLVALAYGFVWVKFNGLIGAKAAQIMSVLHVNYWGSVAFATIYVLYGTGPNVIGLLVSTLVYVYLWKSVVRISKEQVGGNPPNQPPLRMPVSGTPAADAPVAPPPGIAGR